MKQRYRGLMGVVVLFFLMFLSVSFPITVIAANQELQEIKEEKQETEKELSPDEVWAQKGLEFYEKKDYPSAIDCYQKAQKLNPNKISWPLKLSEIYYTIEKFPEALQVLEGVWGTFPGEENRKQIQMSRADVHVWWGVNLKEKYDHLNAIKHYKEAYKIDKYLRPKDSAVDLNEIGVMYDYLGEKEKALEYYEKALPIFVDMGDRADEDATLNNIGKVYADIGENEKALGYHERSLRLSRAVGDRASEAITLNNIGAVYSNLGEKKKALDYYEKALTLRQAVGNHGGEAETLNNIGLVYSDLGENEKALGYYERSLRLSRAVGDRVGEANTLNNIGVLYSALGEKGKALGYLEQALILFSAVGDRASEATTLNNIGLVYDDLGEKEKALGYYERSLRLSRAVGDRVGVATTLNNIGYVYDSLGEKEKALRFYEKVLPLCRAVGDQSGEARTLNNIGYVYHSLGENEKALEYYEKVLPIWIAVGDRDGEAVTLNNIGAIYDDLGKKEKALGYYEKALPIRRTVGDRAGEAATLNNIGVIYDDLGAKKKALSYLEKALQIIQVVGERAGETIILNNLMHLWIGLNVKQMAIFYGKQTVNGFQCLRENIVTLDKEIKSTYLKTEKDTYRHLINLLINQRRLDEALLVLDMLKAEEYYQFIEKDNSSILPDRQYQPLEFTTIEQQWLQKYNTHLDNISKVSSQYQELLMAKPKNETEQNRLTELEIQLKEANNAYEKYLLDLKVAFAEYDQKVKKGEYEGLNLADKPNSIQSILRHLDNTEGGKNVTLHYLVFGDKIQIILTTPTFQTVQSSTIDQKKLDTLIGNYQAAINYSRSRGVTLIPQPTAETAPLTSTELYDIIFKPIEKDLNDYGATNLMVYLDGVLRYIPLPVLFDGQNYLVQRYRLSLLTTSSLLNIKDEPVQNLKILGMAAGKGGTDIYPLPNARAEIRTIVRDTSSGCNGFIDGKALVDEKFTRATMMQQLKTFSFPLVHIASHFQFSSENETQNFLMLGDSTKLTLRDIRIEGNLFHNVEMLVLAACQTAMGSSSGAEIDSFGELAQKNGAKSVVASLWMVNDKSSKDLMVNFYRNIKDHRFSSKIEAMRQAQLELAGLDDLLQTDKQTKRKRTPYASPYYWGPYIMMGNWR